MSNFFMQMFGKNIEKSLAENPAKSPIQAILSNPMVKGMLKSYRKEITEAIEKGEIDLIAAIEKVELLPGEKQIAPVLDIDTDEHGRKFINLLIVAFDDNMTITRSVNEIPLRTYLTTQLNKTLK